MVVFIVWENVKTSSKLKNVSFSFIFDFNCHPWLLIIVALPISVRVKWKSHQHIWSTDSFFATRILSIGINQAHSSLSTNMLSKWHTKSTCFMWISQFVYKRLDSNTMSQSLSEKHEKDTTGDLYVLWSVSCIELKLVVFAFE